MAKEIPEPAAKQSTLLPWIQRHAALIVIESSLPLAIGLLPPVVVMILMILLPAGFLIVPFGAGYWWGSAIGRGDCDTGLRRLALLERSGLEPEAYLLKGLALAQAGRFDEARTLCEEGLLTAKSPVVRRILLDGLARVSWPWRSGKSTATAGAVGCAAPPALSPHLHKLAMVMLERSVTPEKALAYSEKALAAQESMGFRGKVIYFLDKSEPAKRHLLHAWRLPCWGATAKRKPPSKKPLGVPIATEKKTTNLVPSPRISAVRLLKTRLQGLDSRRPIRERLSRIKIPQNLVIAA